LIKDLSLEPVALTVADIVFGFEAIELFIFIGAARLIIDY
jgi:hypothetical protein